MSSQTHKDNIDLNSIQVDNAIRVPFRLDEEHVPKIGMVFASEDETFKFYNEYVKTIGFSV